MSPTLRCDPTQLILAPTESAGAAAQAKGVTLTNHFVAPDYAGLPALSGLADAGQLRVHVARTFPPVEAGAAQQFLKEERPIGKVVLLP